MSEEAPRPDPQHAGLIDRDHLRAQTMGDEALSDELLLMLLAQVEALPGEIDRVGAEGRAALGHRLAGAAANLGARRLEAAARAVAVLDRSADGAAAVARLLGEAAALASALRAATCDAVRG